MSCENNCARKCFVGDVDEKERYPFGCPTKEEADARYAKKSDTYSKAEVDEKISHVSIDAYSRAESDEKFADKNDVYSKTEVDDKYATNEALTNAEESVTELVEELDNKKADKDAMQSLESIVTTKASQSTVTALAQTVEQKADKSEIKDLGLVVVDGLLCVQYEEV